MLTYKQPTPAPNAAGEAACPGCGWVGSLGETLTRESSTPRLWPVYNYTSREWGVRPIMVARDVQACPRCECEVIAGGRAGGDAGE